MPMRQAIRGTGAAALLVLATLPLGCDGAAPVPTDKAAEIPVYNPSPDNKFKDVTLKNEFQNKEKIGAVPPPH